MQHTEIPVLSLDMFIIVFMVYIGRLIDTYIETHVLIALSYYTFKQMLKERLAFFFFFFLHVLVCKRFKGIYELLLWFSMSAVRRNVPHL